MLWPSGQGIGLAIVWSSVRTSNPISARLWRHHYSVAWDAVPEPMVDSGRIHRYWFVLWHITCQKGHDFCQPGRIIDKWDKIKRFWNKVIEIVIQSVYLNLLLSTLTRFTDADSAMWCLVSSDMRCFLSRILTRAVVPFFCGAQFS